MFREAREARKARQQTPNAAVREIAALEATVLYVQSLETCAEPPQNMFAPFTIQSVGAKGEPDPLQRTVHWAHVDSGSMVCIVYEGVLHAWPELRRYRKPWRHTV